uniref:Uncharacterized protein n=1 Tax=Eptatretus burgeri TaxID=7764 RepID=A0A8C4NJV0_EPTBU
MCACLYLTCPVCMDLFSEPVTLSCGHTFCQRCADGHWSSQEPGTPCTCPTCRASFSSKPRLSRNVLLAWCCEMCRRKASQHCHGKPFELYCRWDDSLVSYLDQRPVDFIHHLSCLPVLLAPSVCEPTVHLDHLLYKLQAFMLKEGSKLERCSLFLNCPFASYLPRSTHQISDDDLCICLWLSVCHADGCTPMLELNSAHPRLVLSEDFLTATVTDLPEPYPSHADRFESHIQVLGSVGFSTGCHYWEVDLSSAERCSVGAAYASTPRKCYGPSSMLGRNPMSWCVRKAGTAISAMQDWKETVLGTAEPLRLLGLCLDYEAGTLSCYRAETMTLLHIFRTSFNKPVFPALQHTKGTPIQPSFGSLQGWSLGPKSTFLLYQQYHDNR